MARSRVRLNEEDLRLLTALGQKLYVRYDEGEILYSMGRNYCYMIVCECLAYFFHQIIS